MANPFEAAVDSLIESGENLSSILREFADAVKPQDRETAQLICEIADVVAESEYNGTFDDDDDDDLEDEAEVVA